VGTLALPPNLTTVAASLAHSLEYYQNFVSAAYSKYLGRTPGAAEVLPFAQQMQQGRLSDEQLEASFIGSSEYIANHGGLGAAWVTALYQDLLGRTPNSAEVEGWLTALGNGANPAQVAYGFAASPEREAIRVNDVYVTLLGRTASQAEVQGWVSAFKNGTSNEDVIAGFTGSREYFDRKGQSSAAGWVAAAFLDVLRRDPSEDEVTTFVRLLG